MPRRNGRLLGENPYAGLSDFTSDRQHREFQVPEAQAGAAAKQFPIRPVYANIGPKDPDRHAFFICSGP